MDLVKAVYQISRRFPSDEKFGLTAQIRRAAVSIPSNIAEGQSRSSKGEFKQFLGIARGSLSELETQLLIAQDLEFAAAPDVARTLEQTSELGRILAGLTRSLDRTK